MIHPFSTEILECFLTCPRGLEEITAQDISPHCQNAAPESGGVTFTGDLQTLYSVNLYSRTGMYALVKLCEFSANNQKDLYYQIADYPWNDWISHDDTFSIRSRVFSEHFPDPNFVTLKVKDAIVDRIRQKTKRRPNIDKENPRYSLFIFIHGEKVSVFLNSSGPSLSKRGYRQKIHKAAINEALAAGLVLLSGWEPSKPLYDPMCGSGTIPIEAAMIGRNIPAGNYRQWYAFKGWKNFNPRLWNSVMRESREKIKNDQLHIYGSDNVGANIDLSKKNARKILIHTFIQFTKKEFNEFEPNIPGGTILMNPPYGERMGEKSELEPLYKLMGSILKQNCVDSDAFIFSGDRELTRMIGLKAHRSYILNNGKIECRFLHYPMRHGKYVE